MKLQMDCQKNEQREMHDQTMMRKFAILAALAAALTLCSAQTGRSARLVQDRHGPGSVESALSPLPSFGIRGATPPALEKTFHDVLWTDLEYAGVLELVSPSFYPSKIPSQPSELNAPEWANAPANANMLAYGNLSIEGSNLAAAGFLSDVHNPTAPIALQKIYRGAATDADARKLAHQFADDIIGRLSGGLAGIAQTQIAYISTKSGNKEVWAMDYDGANQHQLTHLKSVALTPRWSPDATRIAFTCFVPYRGITSPQICIFSTARTA